MPIHPPSLYRLPVLAALLASTLSQPASAATWVYVSNADSQEVSVLELDRSAGRLKPVETVPVGGMVMPLAVSPDKRFLYAALRSQPFRVVSFSIEARSGKLQKLGEAPLADSMANVSVDRSGRWLFAASYPGHKITVNGIDAKGAAGSINQLILTAPHAHAIHADTSNQFVLATSLGGDNLSTWRFDAAKGQLSAGDPPLTTTTAKSGPRHFVWSASQKHLYLLNELDASLDVFAWDGARGALRHLQRASALPAGFNGKPWAADLRLSPDGRFLYASERSSSTIAWFRVDANTGLVQPAGHAATEKTPRGFALDSSGRFLVAAGQESHAVALYPLDPTTGALGEPQRLSVGKNPNWVEIVELP